MNSSPEPNGGAGGVRRRAEERLRQVQGGADEVLTREEALVLLHELRVHQIELEMQNDELHSMAMRARASASLKPSRAISRSSCVASSQTTTRSPSSASCTRFSTSSAAS